MEVAMQKSKEEAQGKAGQEGVSTALAAVDGASEKRGEGP